MKTPPAIIWVVPLVGYLPEKMTIIHHYAQISEGAEQLV